MSVRPELKDKVFLLIAEDLGVLSTCDRAAVGAVIVRDGRCVTWGFNGAPPGLPHCSENGHGWGTVDKQPEMATLKELIPGWPEIAGLSDQELLMMPWDWKGGVEYLASKRGCRNATHAESNALAYAARQGISTEGGTLYVSISPCLDCARLLVAAGISRTVASKAYRETAGVELLREAGVIVEVH